jgi:hypothetical protein
LTLLCVHRLTELLSKHILEKGRIMTILPQ